MAAVALWAGRRAPITLVGGYLGSGKTTLINHMLATVGDRRLVVLVNDVGEVSVDAALIGRRTDRVLELKNGCVCCSIADGFGEALETIRRDPEPPDQVVVELSGVAEPARVVPWASTAGFCLDGVVVLVDADSVRDRAGDRYVGDTLAAQLAAADMLVITRTDLCAADYVARLEGWLSDRSSAPQFVAIDGRLDPDLVLGPKNPVGSRSPSGGEPEAETRGTHRVETRTIEEGITQVELQSLLDALPDAVVRVKGIVQCVDADTPLLVQGVGTRRTVSPVAGLVGDDGGGTLVVIRTH